jgi:hypothetical protein
MAHYYFHVFNDEVCLDEEGQELPGIEAATEVALEAARELVCESVHHGHLNLDHHIDVMNEDGSKAITVTFRDAFTITGR